jgi:hypothetical protein
LGPIHQQAHLELDEMGRAGQLLAQGVTPTASDDVPRGGIVEGGYDWTCGQFAAIPQYFKREDVRTALHLPNKNGKV